MAADECPKRYAMIGYAINLFLTVIVFLCFAIPPSPITAGEIWCSYGTKPVCDSMLPVIIFSLIMIVYLCLSIFLFDLSSPIIHAYYYKFACIFETFVGVCGWVSIGFVIMFTDHGKYWNSETGKVERLESTPPSWTVGIFLTFTLSMTHLFSCMCILGLSVRPATDSERRRHLASY